MSNRPETRRFVMSRRGTRGYTLVEMLVVAAIIVTVMAAVVFFMMSSRRSGERDERQEEYWRQLALLQAMVKRDLRNSVNLTEEDGGYLIETVSMKDDGDVSTEKIRYVVDARKGVVERRDDTGVKRYEFKQYLDGQKFIFKLARH